MTAVSDRDYFQVKLFKQKHFWNFEMYNQNSYALRALFIQLYSVSLDLVDSVPLNIAFWTLPGLKH